MKEKLDNKLETTDIKQTRNKEGSASPSGSASPRSRLKRSLLAFRDSAIDKITRTNTEFGDRKYRLFKFDVSKGTSLKGLLLRFARTTERKDFTMDIWIHGKKTSHTIGTFPSIKCKDVEKICLELAETHQDERGYWIKNPIQTKADNKRLITKKDTTRPTGKTLNEVGESYCGTDEEESLAEKV